MSLSLLNALAGNNWTGFLLFCSCLICWVDVPSSHAWPCKYWWANKLERNKNRIQHFETEPTPQSQKCMAESTNSCHFSPHRCFTHIGKDSPSLGCKVCSKLVTISSVLLLQKPGVTWILGVGGSSALSMGRTSPKRAIIQWCSSEKWS